MTDDKLRAWAEDVREKSGGRPVRQFVVGLELLSAGVLRLLDENAALRKQVEGHCERVAKQSELLSRKAEGQVVVVQGAD